MNLIKRIVGMLVIVVFTTESVNAQTFDSLMYKAYLTGSQDLWESALKAKTEEVPLQRAIAFYGILNNTMATYDAKEFDKYVDSALQLLEAMEREGVHKAEAMALRSSIYGFIMAYYPAKGMMYGAKSGSAMGKALNIGGNSAIVNMISGTSLFFTPEAWGGDKQAAISAFENALKLYEQQEYQGWLCLNKLASLGQAHMAVGQKSEAISIYKKALLFEPNFTWVSQQLLPVAEGMED